jgi:hypothetical protein
MKDETKARLEAILDVHEAAKHAAAQTKHVRETKEEVFLREFNRIREAIIRPAMEEIGKHVQLRSCSFEIHDEDERLPDPHRGGGRNPSIAIIFFPGEQRTPRHQFPALTVFCDKHNECVIFHDRTITPGKGGTAGSSGEVPLEQITSDLIQERILNVLQKTFK